MTEKITFTIDGKTVEAHAGQTILEAAEEAGIYIPRLCYRKDLSIHGSCRLCTVKVNGRAQASCNQPVAPGIVVESNTEELQQLRRDIIDMLFVEGNHFCMFCEKSGNCELQAQAYLLGIMAPRFPQLSPLKDVDASHPDIFLDRNRCILCGRCVRASKELDGKNALGFVNRGHRKSIAADGTEGIGGTSLEVTDKAAEVCPVGALLPKRRGFSVPVGQRQYDHAPIGSDVSCKDKGSDQ